MAAKKPTTTKKAAKPARKKPAAKAKPPRPPHGKAPPTAAEAPRKRGRTSRYDPKVHPVIAQGLAKGGATDLEIADAIGIAMATFYSWASRYPDFAEALKLGKSPTDERVVRSLYRRAIGYTFDALKIQVLRDGSVVKVPYREHVAPDTTACIFWLKNRDRDNWRDKQEVEHSLPPEIHANFGPPDGAPPEPGDG